MEGPFTDSLELVSLRMSLAKVCQVAGVQTEQLPVLGKSEDHLCYLAKTEERGWNTLSRALLEHLRRRSGR